MSDRSDRRSSQKKPSSSQGELAREGEHPGVPPADAVYPSTPRPRSRSRKRLKAKVSPPVHHEVNTPEPLNPSTELKAFIREQFARQPGLESAALFRAVLVDPVAAEHLTKLSAESRLDRGTMLSIVKVGVVATFEPTSTFVPACEPCVRRATCLRPTPKAVQPGPPHAPPSAPLGRQCGAERGKEGA